MPLSPEEKWEAKMQKLTKSVIKSGKLKTRRNVGEKLRKRDKLLNKVKGDWITNSCFIDNQKMIITPETGEARIEVMLNSIKHVVPVESGAEFAMTWSCRDTELSDAFSPAKMKMKEDQKSGEEFSFSMGMSDSDDEDGSLSIAKKDRVLMFRAPSEEDAKSWVNALNRAIQISDTTQVASSASVLREYSTVNGVEIAAGAALNVRPSRAANSRRKRQNLNKAEKIWTTANKEAKEKLPKEVQTAGRTVGSVGSTVSTIMVGGFVKSLLKAGVAPVHLKRRATEIFQRIWVQAIIWLIPPMLFHVTGDIPAPVSNSHESKRRSRKRSSKRHVVDRPVRIFLLNSACESDMLLLMILAKAIEDAHGNVKGFLSYEERHKLFGLGTLFDLFGFLFLSRKSKEERQELDRKRIAKFLRHLEIEDGDDWLVIFPERGWASEVGIAKQNKRSGKRPKLENLLLPDANELEACLDNLKKGRKIQVYDLTLSYEGYTGELPPNEKKYTYRKIDRKLPTYKTLLAGGAADNIYIDSKLFSGDDILDHADGVQGWLDERWERKDKLLHYFSQYQEFPADTDSSGTVRQDAFSVEGSILPMMLVWLFNILTFSFIFVYLI